MKRRAGKCTTALIGAFSLSLPAGAALAADPVPAAVVQIPAPEFDGLAFTTQLGMGPSTYVLDGHTIAALGANLGLGARFGTRGSLYGDFGFAYGETRDGLTTTLGGMGVLWEFALGRVRPGIGARAYYLRVARATRHDFMADVAGAARASLRVDAVRTENLTFALGTTAEVGAVGEGLLLAGVTFEIGMRVRVP